MILILEILLVFFMGSYSIESVDYVNPYLGGIAHPKYTFPTYPFIGLPSSTLRIYPPREDFTTDYLRGIPLSNPNYRSKATFRFNPQQGTDSSLARSVDYSFDLERITPYNYSVYLDESEIQVSLAVTSQGAVVQFEYEKEGTNYLVIDTTGTLEVKIESNSGLFLFISLL
jgi:hypothetical protein